MIEKLLKFFIAKIDAQLFKTIEVKYLKSSNVQYTNKSNPEKYKTYYTYDQIWVIESYYNRIEYLVHITFVFNLPTHIRIYQCFITLCNKITELALKHCPSYSSHTVICLCRVLPFHDPFSTNFYLWLHKIFTQSVSIDT